MLCCERARKSRQRPRKHNHGIMQRITALREPSVQSTTRKSTSRFYKRFIITKWSRAITQRQGSECIRKMSKLCRHTRSHTHNYAGSGKKRLDKAKEATLRTAYDENKTECVRAKSISSNVHERVRAHTKRHRHLIGSIDLMFMCEWYGWEGELVEWHEQQRGTVWLRRACDFEISHKYNNFLGII